MGNIADAIRNVYLEENSTERFRVTQAHMMGHRDTQEDQSFCLNPWKTPDACCVALFDGHFGSEAAVGVKKMLMEKFNELPSPLASQAELTKIILACDVALCEQLKKKLKFPPQQDGTVPASIMEDKYGKNFKPLQMCSPTSGSTGVMCFLHRQALESKAHGTSNAPHTSKPLTGASSSSHSRPPPVDQGPVSDNAYVMRVANVGDSRCMLLRRRRDGDGFAMEEMSEDHRPDRESESKRIENMPGKYIHRGRVMGQLAVSRGFGDLSFKLDPNVPFHEQAVTANPEWMQTVVHPGDFVLLYCDGVTEKMPNEKLFSSLSSWLQQSLPHTETLRRVHELALEHGSTDNISTILVEVGVGGARAFQRADREYCFLDRKYLSTLMEGPSSRKRVRLLTDLRENGVSWEIVEQALPENVRGRVTKPEDWSPVSPVNYELLDAEPDEADEDCRTPPRSPTSDSGNSPLGKRPSHHATSPPPSNSKSPRPLKKRRTLASSLELGHKAGTPQPVTGVGVGTSTSVGVGPGTAEPASSPPKGKPRGLGDSQSGGGTNTKGPGKRGIQRSSSI